MTAVDALAGAATMRLDDQHLVQFYDVEDELVGVVGEFLGTGLASGEAVLVVATPAHRASFEWVLRAAGHDLTAACDDGRYVMIDAAELLAAVTDPMGTPDRDRFLSAVGALVDELASGERNGGQGRQVRVFGEIVSLLWDAGDVPAAMRIEELWNELSTLQRFTLFCGYPTPPLSTEADLARFYETCTHHTSVIRHSARCATESWRRFEATAQAPRAARRFVAAVLGHWSLGSLVDDARLVVSELATNAVLHTGAAFHVSIGRTVEGVRIAVHDATASLPVPRSFGTSAGTGRGIHIVNAVADCWGAEPLGAGRRKAVWAELSAR